MIGFFIQRLLQALAVMAAMSVIVFVGVYAIGNPIDVMIDPASDQALRAALIRRYGFDRPLMEQYFIFMGNLLRGDLGDSFIYHLPVLGLIFARLPATLELAVTAMLIATCLGIPLGLWAGYRPDAISSRCIMGLSVLGFSVPTFWVGLLLIMAFAVELGWLFARAQGLSESKVVGLHVLKNISIPIVTVFGLEFGSTLAFAVVTETVFNWPGMGKLIIDSITVLDRSVMVAYLILVVFLFVLINFVVDMVYGQLDPRIRVRAPS